MYNLAAHPLKKGTLDMQPRFSSASFMQPRGFSISDVKEDPWLNHDPNKLVSMNS